jgi:hypothetical protein
MENNKILPVGLKGRQINERMIQLMGIQPINENKANSAVELTKIGPDGKSYAIIRENHEYYIKVADKTSELVLEDFKYIGGLQNKKLEAHGSYAKAIKHLNLNFKSLAEAYGKGGDINVFENDNLLSEAGVAGFSSNMGNGFTGEGNLEGNKAMYEAEEIEDNDDEMTDIEEAIDKMIEEDKLVGGQDKLDADKDGDIEADDLADLRAGKKVDEELVGDQDKLDADKDGDIEADDLKDLRDKKDVKEHKLSISRAMESMDSIIEGLKKKVQ